MSRETMGSEQDKPDWWKENNRIREEMDLPPYDPPRFIDGVYLHEVVDDLKAECDCTIRFVGENTEYGDDWDIRIDGDRVAKIGRHRNENANTVYEMTASEFRTLVRSTLRDE
ncbi:hypothetical protein [Natrialbaceae archaeon AArc-T1-2]|uniref:hypothetical protein n=1 Tax=Natrialbaceae archaeon AArc-T1-2 TaxID=3053904 RepID=UPI00255B1F0D|nr:hypothetical protein [Natrialbaceae archaeon AArc-T1-2]WIV65899.1 hypothetical protein QQ977_09320 [Natrialbaceae archaeon AArc-T1-2]